MLGDTELGLFSTIIQWETNAKIYHSNQLNRGVSHGIRLVNSRFDETQYKIGKEANRDEMACKKDQNLLQLKLIFGSRKAHILLLAPPRPWNPLLLL